MLLGHTEGAAPGDPGRAAGRLFGVGVGPGDPELMTIKALRAIEAPAAQFERLGL